MYILYIYYIIYRERINWLINIRFDNNNIEKIQKVVNQIYLKLTWKQNL